MLSQGQKQQTRQLLQDPRWGVVEQLINELCVKIRENSAIRETADQTVQEACLQEGRVQGLRMLVQAMYEAAANEQGRTDNSGK